MISFIIPAFNASDTIIRCLDSIYGLPIDKFDFEVIVIDDCSTDNTVKIVKRYAESHNNLILLCQLENHRVGAARNKGVAIAKGKYIVFVDSDDESAKGVLSAVRLAEENNLDMVACCYFKFDNNGNVDEVVNVPIEENMVFTGIEMQTKYPYWSYAVWHYVYGKSFLDEVNYPFAEDVLYEDADFVNVHLFYAKRMSYCDECGYVHHYNFSSITHTLSYKHLCDYALLGTRMLRFYENIEDKFTHYSKSILESGSYNVMKAFSKLPRLESVSEIAAFYERFDSRYDRKMLLKYKNPSYCWNRWTRICLMHRGFASVIVVIAICFFRIGNVIKIFFKK